MIKKLSGNLLERNPAVVNRVVASVTGIADNQYVLSLDAIESDTMTDDELAAIASILGPVQDRVSLAVDGTYVIGDGEDERVLFIVDGIKNHEYELDCTVGTTSQHISILTDESGSGTFVFSCDTPSTKIKFALNDELVEVYSL